MVLDTLSAADRVNLLEVYSRSAMLLELGRVADWLALFEPRAVIRLVGLRTGSAEQTFEREAGLLALARRWTAGDFDFGAGRVGPAKEARHFLNNICLFEVDRRSVTAYAHLSILSTTRQDTQRCLASGLYTDQLTKCASGCWRFVSRLLTTDGASISTSTPARVSLQSM